ncbi:hypothetical protein NXY56_000408 [Leishmania guyanensis]|uniref:Uncharacterized protein n=1 Tax=Leishmania guyanensis TaxID=5670 RepID=A0A1E1INQ9_LEIGU|nr:hypothetical protein, conserved [Leishmania guyanensis]
MVSVLVQRQQREAAMRKERLLAARQAAAALSIQQARSYQRQKQHQEACVREDARQLWLQSNARDVAVIDGLVARATTEQGEAQEAAAHYEASLKAEANEEVAAWQAERQLEAARHRLAVAYTRTEAHERMKQAREAEQRRAAVRVTEKARAVRVAAAAPAALSLSSVLGCMSAAPVAMHVPGASVPVPQASRTSLRTAAAPTAGVTPVDAPRRWRISHAAPHAHVTLHSAPTHHVAPREEGERSVMAAVDDVVPASAGTYAEECVAVQQQRDDVLTDGQERATRRAASVLRQQRAKELQKQQEEQAQRERLATVKAHYRHPREESVPSGGKEVTGMEGGTHPVTATTGSSSNGSLDDQHHHPQPQRPLQRLTRHQRSYLKGEEDFRAAFVEAPPVVLRLGEQLPRRAPLSELLRPVRMEELLYSTAHADPRNLTLSTPVPHYGSSTAAAVVSPPFPMAAEMPPSMQPSAKARVLPSAPLRMLPLDHCSSPACATTESAPADKDAGVTPLSIGEKSASPLPAPRDPNDAPPTSLHVSPAGSTALSPMRVGVLVGHGSLGRMTSPERAAGTEEVVALSPLTPVPPATSACVAESPSSPPKHSGEAPGELGQGVTSMGASDATLAYGQQPLAEPEGRWATSARATTPALPPVSSSMTECTPVRHRYRCNATPPSSLSSSSATTTETAEPVSGSSSPTSVGSGSSSGIDASSPSNETTSSGGSSRYPMPVMTAEQLKLALLRLRSRIKSVQV